MKDVIERLREPFAQARLVGSLWGALASAALVLALTLPQIGERVKLSLLQEAALANSFAFTALAILFIAPAVARHFDRRVVLAVEAVLGGVATASVGFIKSPWMLVAVGALIALVEFVEALGRSVLDERVPLPEQAAALKVSQRPGERPGRGGSHRCPRPLSSGARTSLMSSVFTFTLATTQGVVTLAADGLGVTPAFVGLGILIAVHAPLLWLALPDDPPTDRSPDPRASLRAALSDRKNRLGTLSAAVNGAALGSLVVPIAILFEGWHLPGLFLAGVVTGRQLITAWTLKANRWGRVVRKPWALPAANAAMLVPVPFFLAASGTTWMAVLVVLTVLGYVGLDVASNAVNTSVTELTPRGATARSVLSAGRVLGIAALGGYSGVLVYRLLGDEALIALHAAWVVASLLVTARFIRHVREKTLAEDELHQRLAFGLVDGEPWLLFDDDSGRSVALANGDRVELLDSDGKVVLPVTVKKLSTLRERLAPPQGRTGTYHGRGRALHSPCFAPGVRLRIGRAPNVTYRVERDGLRLRLTIAAASTRDGAEREVAGWRLIQSEPLGWHRAAVDRARRAVEKVRATVSAARVAGERLATPAVAAGGLVALTAGILLGVVALMALALPAAAGLLESRVTVWRRRAPYSVERLARITLLGGATVGAIGALFALVGLVIMVAAPSPGERLDQLAAVPIAGVVAVLCARRAHVAWATLGRAYVQRAATWAAVSQLGLRPVEPPAVGADGVVVTLPLPAGIEQVAYERGYTALLQGIAPRVRFKVRAVTGGHASHRPA